jgi:hypothetical protein
MCRGTWKFAARRCITQNSAAGTQFSCCTAIRPMFTSGETSFHVSRSAGVLSPSIKHNFVVNYNYELPAAKLSGRRNRWTEGWALSGITRFANGLPVTFASFGDNALVYVQNNGVNSVSIDLPNYTPGNLHINDNPRNGQPYFNTALFTPNALGTQGNQRGASSTARESTISTLHFTNSLKLPKAKRWSSVSKRSTRLTMRSSIRTAQ